jgi:hypothetical protein
LARTTCDLVGWLGVRFGLLYPANVSPLYSIAIVSTF